MDTMQTGDLVVGPMKFALKLVVLLVASPVLANVQTSPESEGGNRIEEDTIPKAVPVETYRPVWENSPFQLEAPAPEAVDTASFAQDLVISGILSRGGTNIVTILDKKSGEYSTITDEKPKEGAPPPKLLVVEVIQNQNPNLEKARISNGDEEAVIEFDMALIAAAPSRPTPKPQGQNPIKPKNQTGSSIRQHQNTQPTTPPRMQLPPKESRPPPNQGDRIKIVVPVPRGDTQN